MRFLTDMGITPRLVEWLNEKGHNAIHLREQQLQRLADDAVLKKAQTEERILLTSDLDFGYLMAINHLSLPSVVIFRLSNMRPDNVLTHFEQVLVKHDVDLVAGHIVVITDRHIRIRKLPIGLEGD